MSQCPPKSDDAKTQRLLEECLTLWRALDPIQKQNVLAILKHEQADIILAYYARKRVQA